MFGCLYGNPLYLLTLFWDFWQKGTFGIVLERLGTRYV